MRKVSGILRNRRGMTMVEVLAGILLFTIIATSVTAVFVPLLRLYDRSNELAEINTLLDNLSGEILSDLAMSASIKVEGEKITAATGFGIVEYEVNAGGLLCRAGVPVLEERYYKGKSVELQFLANNSAAATATTPAIENSLSNGPVTNSFYVKLTIFDKDNEPLANRWYAVNPLFL